VTNPLRTGLRLAGFALLLAAGGLIVTLLFPRLRVATRRAIRSGWARAALMALDVRVSAPEVRVPAGTLLVANHVSWLDVLAINALQPAAFVCKDEIRRWPLIGRLAAESESVFIRRGSPNDARRVKGELARRLAAGEVVALFPEGTTTDGAQVLAFRGALLQAAIDAGAPLLPLALRYEDDARFLSSAAPFIGETSFLCSLLRIAAAPSVNLRMAFGKPITGDERRALAARARAQVVARMPPVLLSLTQRASGNGGACASCDSAGSSLRA
jgi:1-acyl-sn-glycerol-3-phosphate acyltransferase